MRQHIQMELPGMPPKDTPKYATYEEIKRFWKWLRIKITKETQENYENQT